MEECKEHHFRIKKPYGPQNFVNQRLIEKGSLEADEYELLSLMERPKNASVIVFRK